MYVSLVSAHGGTDWSNSFYLTYMYSEPGSDFAHRYLIVRKVDVLPQGNPGDPQVRVALSEYLAASGNGDQWATTAYTPGFNLLGSLGNLFTKQQTGMLKLVDCSNASTADHFVSSQQSCEGKGTYLRTLGFIWDFQTGPAKPSTSRLWRCVNPNTQKHAVVSGQTCDTKPGFQAELLLGYIENPG
jgi:hypothetical protein